jgi:hypothetical protein
VVRTLCNVGPGRFKKLFEGGTETLAQGYRCFGGFEQTRWGQYRTELNHGGPLKSPRDRKDEIHVSSSEVKVP